MYFLITPFVVGGLVLRIYNIMKKQTISKKEHLNDSQSQESIGS